MTYRQEGVRAVRGRFRLLGGSRKDEAAGADYFDYNLLAVVILLTAFGLVMQYSVTAYSMLQVKGHPFMKQILICAGGMVILIAASRIDYHGLAKGSGILFAGSILLVIATRFIGKNVNGATRWIDLGFIQFQPSEVAKLAVILYIPLLITMMGVNFGKYKRAPARILGIGLLTAFLVYKFTDNLSTAIIIFGICFVMVIVAHPHPRGLVALFFAALAAVYPVYLVLKRVFQTASSTSFRYRRILTWLNPEKYQKEGGYQVMQGLYAIGSGGLFGKGLGNSAQKLGVLPEAENDMIFAIVCEELGLVGAFILTGLFIYLLYRLFFIALNAPDRLGALIVVGIFSHVAIQVVLNIAVVLSIIPTTGITLPFVSAGGTSLWFLIAEMGIALNISGQIIERKKS
ncbi:FtsW/RodA/SpoVE family cell cycle protein [Porcincola sp. LCP21S3_C12]|uniref:FtsW/RodA/SpoVE family cell cycle protein n=1 Tax=Porcincola sp. LCP21S3_C12 TaxID=3438798 RepID=UPI003F9BD8C2